MDNLTAETPAEFLAGLAKALNASEDLPRSYPNTSSPQPLPKTVWNRQ